MTLNLGRTHSHIKSLKGKDLGGIFEIRADYDKDTYRAVICGEFR